MVYLFNYSITEIILKGKNNMVLKRIKEEGTLSERAYKSIKQSILSLDLKPGEMVLEDNLSNMLGISRTPIREALKKLIYEGLVTITPGKGTHVTELTVEDFLNICPIRNTLELLSVRMSAENRTEKNIEILYDLLEEQKILMKQSTLNQRRYLEIDRKFHMTIVSSTKNDILVKYLLQINEYYNRYLFFTRFESRAENVVIEHSEIIDAIKSRDKEKAERLMEYHLNGVSESILSALIELNRA